MNLHIYQNIYNIRYTSNNDIIYIYIYIYYIRYIYFMDNKFYIYNIYMLTESSDTITFCDVYGITRYYTYTKWIS